MAAQELDHEIATENEIVAFCTDAGNALIGGISHGNQVVKISSKAVVKFGIGVKQKEGRNQTRAYELIDQNIVCVPVVYRCFMRGYVGYIVMEYMNGRPLEKLEESSLIQRIKDIMAYLATIRGSSPEVFFEKSYSPVPGPLCGGAPAGLLWDESEETIFHTIEALERWFNRRLRKEDTKVRFSDYELVLCHLDIAPRNFILLDDGSISLLDWQSAGFYPRIFEVCVFHLAFGGEHSFAEDVVKPADWNDEEQAVIASMGKAWGNTIRNHFKSLFSLDQDQQSMSETNFLLPSD
ncbi:Protein kinase-like (PK-like) [Glarea lozoyensis ATCC 20868]|uniref:Protein kinase-like (PK-like) n=1 Tax=Glarea lozoyensis (strain ATCC 20868 / MF5171) TaxID=1116229 RepID=S3D2P5_GLAL2|nr:Protein kinase-like (PK-like) [Glarea lozoyensis ATCC 20868]EPE26291.1 Protein kinase-like (PK-like) [Glarea lozoyensis ATCC 20868]